MFSQQQTKLKQQKYDTEIVKLDMLLKSKKGQIDSNLQMATLYQKMGQVVKAVGRMEIVEELMKEIGSLETIMYEMKNGGAEVSTDTPKVLIFLKKATRRWELRVLKWKS